MNFVWRMGSSSHLIDLRGNFKEIMDKKFIISANNCDRYRKYRLLISGIPVIDFGNTGYPFQDTNYYHFQKSGRRYIFKYLCKFEGEIEDSKNMEGVRNVSIYGIKNAVSPYKCPFNRILSLL